MHCEYRLQSMCWAFPNLKVLLIKPNFVMVWWKFKDSVWFQLQWEFGRPSSIPTTRQEYKKAFAAF